MVVSRARHNAGRLGWARKVRRATYEAETAAPSGETLCCRAVLPLATEMRFSGLCDFDDEAAGEPVILVMG